MVPTPIVNSHVATPATLYNTSRRCSTNRNGREQMLGPKSSASNSAFVSTELAWMRHLPHLPGRLVYRSPCDPERPSDAHGFVILNDPRYTDPHTSKRFLRCASHYITYVESREKGETAVFRYSLL